MPDKTEPRVNRITKILNTKEFVFFGPERMIKAEHQITRLVTQENKSPNYQLKNASLSLL